VSFNAKFFVDFGFAVCFTFLDLRTSFFDVSDKVVEDHFFFVNWVHLEDGCGVVHYNVSDVFISSLSPDISDVLAKIFYSYYFRGHFCSGKVTTKVYTLIKGWSRWG
jgi:hypothetical protein